MEKTVISFKLEESKIELFTKYYEPYLVENANPYVVHAYKKDNMSILLYSSNSVVIQGKDIIQEGLLWGYKESSWDIICNHAGSDEVGTGDYFGPIVVVSAYVKENQYQELADLGINDSKKLTDKFILEVTPKLIEKYPHSILILDNKKFNELHEQGINMNAMKALMHNKALIHVSNRVENIDTYVIDQFCSKDLYFKYIKDEKEIIDNITFITKGESHSPSVALASMIARYTFLVKINELEKKYKINLPLGSSNEVADFANTLLKEKGMEFLREICKVNFKTINK